MTAPASALRVRVGSIAALVILVVYGGCAVTVDFASAAGGFYSDNATCHLMAHSLASDGDLEYREEDLARAFREFWLMEVGSSHGFVPAMTEGSPDRRYLGVRVTPIIAR